MKATLYHEAGGPEVLRYADVPDPEPGAADVVVDVAATALNRRQQRLELLGHTPPRIRSCGEGQGERCAPIWDNDIGPASTS